MTDAIQYFTDKFQELELAKQGSALSGFRKKAIGEFIKMGLPVRHEEWKYTRISNVLRKDFEYLLTDTKITANDLKPYRFPANEKNTELVFVNGVFDKELSSIRADDKTLVAMPLEEAASGNYKEIISSHLGHSSHYHKDGIHALNNAFVHGGLFLLLKRGKLIEQPIYIYYVADSRNTHCFTQPRSLVYVSGGAKVQIAETFITLGANDSFTNHITEVVVEQDALVDYYKIQNEGPKANHVGTTHSRQIGKSLMNAVTISLDGAVVRNNLNMIMEAEHGESHMYGLYLLKGNTHLDNHTIVDNVRPHCFSNELYKGIMDEQSTGVFNGKIFVRQDAQKTNAYQSNKNVLLTDTASVYSKPQLEIFADDVKCSHGCTVGKLDEEAMFYLRTRGISEKNAKSLLLHAFAVDILENIKSIALRKHVDKIISERLEFNF